MYLLVFFQHFILYSLENQVDMVHDGLIKEVEETCSSVWIRIWGSLLILSLKNEKDPYTFVPKSLNFLSNFTFERV